MNERLVKTGDVVEFLYHGKKRFGKVDHIFGSRMFHTGFCLKMNVDGLDVYRNFLDHKVENIGHLVW